MCGIFGYYGQKNATQKIIEGLKRLEYRGYDSWGVLAKVAADEENFLYKQTGELGEPSQYRKLNFPETKFAIGHTRWATHGGVSEKNAHPHLSKNKKLALVHNGIVENYIELKEETAQRGYEFVTETDTEVILALIEENVSNGLELLHAVQKTFQALEGRNTFIVVDVAHEEIYAAKNGSPLVIGFTNEKPECEIYFSSDTYSFAPWVSDIFVAENGDLVKWSKDDGLQVFTMKSLAKKEVTREKMSISDMQSSKGEFEHYMIKEIHETPKAIKKILEQNNKDDLLEFCTALGGATNVYVLGSGSSGMTAKQIAYYLRKFGKIKAQGIVGAEATEYYELFGKDDIILAPSQSGETADVLEVLEIAQNKDVRIASIVNMLGSTMSRISNWAFSSESGPEICVMTTKVLSAQMAWGYLLAKICGNKAYEGIENLKKLIKVQERMLENPKLLEQIDTLANKLIHKEHLYMLAKGQNLNIIGEGMVKIIEGSYIHAHAMPAGDLKHYAITLMEEGTTVLCCVSDDENKRDVVSAANEVKTRGADIIVIENGPTETVNHKEKDSNNITLPSSTETDALVNLLFFQLLAYKMAVLRGNNVDKPRNIAKSVTVK